MENHLDHADQVGTQAVSAIVETEAASVSPIEAEGESTIEPDGNDESEETITTQKKKGLHGKTSTRPASKQEEPHPNPLILDPYEWDRCTITVGYSLLPDKKVSVSVHNHKDEPIVKEFPLEEVPLPEKITAVMTTLQHIWSTSPVHTTVVLLPKPENKRERPIIASVRVATDTPIMQEGMESDLPFPAPITAMLEELKTQMPERALKNIEKHAKAKTPSLAKTTSKSPSASKPAATISAPAATKNVRQNQMTLF